ncbi:MAG: tol-pal system protein YbgF [Alphaproteobacteria bacterium]|nr:tol-pal system protein YbgF [Alphaproteobacteria bacterium]
MKKYILFVLVLLMSGIANAKDATVIYRDIEEIREEMKILQRKLYNEGSEEADLGVQVGRMDEQVRSMTGRIDELDYKIKQLSEKIDMINRDIDVRISLMEGKTPTVSSDVQVEDNSPKFAAPVANNAPQSIVGGSISKEDNLQPVKGSTAPEIYQSGLEALKATEYEKAEKAFNKILTKFADDKLAGNAQYWLGETYYARKEFDKAAIAFAKGYQGYKNSAKAADSLLKLGMAMQGLNKNKEACAAFTSLPKEFPKAEKTLKEKAKSEAKKLKCN